MSDKGKWTILTYIAAHNNLDKFGTRSANQILGVGSDTHVSHGVLLDLEGGATRFIAGASGNKECEEQLSEYDSGDPDRLIETAKWVFEKRPAERYGLILWSHGTGWQPHKIRSVAEKAHGAKWLEADNDRALISGSRVLFRTSLVGMSEPESSAERAILFDDGTGHALDTLQLARVTKKLSKFIGQKLDLVGMDACLMGSLEVAHQLRDYADYMVASEELVPVESWPYDGIFNQLKLVPDMTARVLANIIVERYITYYTHHKPPPNGGDVTKVALDLSGVNHVTQAVGRLAALLKDDIDAQADLLWKVQWESFQKESQEQKRESHKFRYHLWDLRSVARRLAEISDSDSVKQAAATVAGTLEPGGPTVLVEGHYGEWFDGIGGVSIYMIPPKTRVPSRYYANLALAKDTRWDEMLEAYHDYYA